MKVQNFLTVAFFCAGFSAYAAETDERTPGWVMVYTPEQEMILKIQTVARNEAQTAAAEREADRQRRRQMAREQAKKDSRPPSANALSRTDSSADLVEFCLNVEEATTAVASAVAKTAYRFVSGLLTNAPPTKEE